MAGSIKIGHQHLKAELKARARLMPRLIVRAQKRAANRSRVALVRKTPVDRGQMKNAWRVAGDARYSPRKGRAPIRIVNDAPYAGVVERGARPHKVSRAGRESLEDWARRKLGVSRKEAKAISFAIAKKLEKEGQKGLFIVQEALPEMRRTLQKEFESLLRKAAKKQASKKRFK